MARRKSKQSKRPRVKARGRLPIKLVVGGPSYRMELDARHAGTMIQLASILPSYGVSVALVGYLHAVPVEMARNKLLSECLERPDIDLALWMDSDCYFAPSELHAVCESLVWASQNGIPFVGYPTTVRGRPELSNVWIHTDAQGGHGQVYWQDILTARAPFGVYSMGMGACVLNLSWYRANWPDGPWFKTVWEGDRLYSEDTWHTSRLHEDHDARVACYPMARLTHADRGGSLDVQTKPTSTSKADTHQTTPLRADETERSSHRRSK